MSTVQSLLFVLRSREYGFKSVSNEHKLLSIVDKTINSEYGNMIKYLSALKLAMNSKVWDDIDTTFADVMMTILDSTDPEQMYTVTDKKAQQREFFVLSGGLQLLLEFFSPPFVKKDARDMSSITVKQKNEFFNGLLVTLREVAFAVPSLSEKIFDDDHIVFLFTLLSHHSLFDNTMNLLEEIIATRPEVFNLSLVPNLFGLIEKFNSRTLSHFCRLFSMLVFEPEDRHIIEGSHVLRSTELLRLRRNRMTKTSVNVVERNQTLVIDMPGLLVRLVAVLRVVNHGPSLHQFIAHNIVASGPLTGETLSFYSAGSNTSDWTHFANLEKLASGLASSGAAFSAEGEEDDMADLLHAFSGGTHSAGIVSSGHYQQVDVQSLVNVMQMAQDLGVASITALGQAIAMSAPLPAQPAPTTGAAGARSSLFNRSRTLLRAGGRLPVNRADPLRAKKELQFHAMLLSTHQIEIIFVMCTLLSGRRKVHVQGLLAAAGLGDVLNAMYDRMSWGVPSAVINSSNAVMHAHGPNCECNTESAVRVQLLRLIHNFHDRDFLGNCNKLHALTGEEVEALLDSEPHERREGDEDLMVPQRGETGLLTKIASTLSSEPADSVYRFWLSACLENFLRGSGNKAQCFVSSLVPHVKTDDASSNSLMTRTLRQVVDSDARSAEAAPSLQTAFDLLGELLKGNPSVGLALDRSLGQTDFDTFWNQVVGNLVDSNVFLRSSYLLLELVLMGGAEEGQNQHRGRAMNRLGFYVNSLRSDDDIFLDRALGENDDDKVRHGYLTHSYVQFAPSPLSTRAMDLFREPNHTRGLKGIKTAVDKSDVSSTQSALRSSLAALTEVLGAVRRSMLNFVDGGGDASDDETHSASNSNSDSEEEDELADLPGLIRLSGGDADASFGLTGSSLLDVEDGREAGQRDYGAELRSVLEDAQKAKRSKATKKDVAGSRAATSAGRHSKDYYPDSDSRKTEERSGALLGCKLFTAIRDDKAKILLRLMSVVSQGSVNHENICCLNTALLVLLFDHNRGCLSSTLNSVRELAEEAYVTLHRKDSFDLEEGEGLEGLCLQCGDDQQTVGAPSEKCACQRGPVSALPATNDALNGPGALLVMRNFRELLWYWREYYLRRGRDRLSIEFSSHVPFADWERLVGLLCLDDGSATALLSGPMPLAVSPFRRPPQGLNRPQDGQIINCSW